MFAPNFTFNKTFGFNVLMIPLIYNVFFMAILDLILACCDSLYSHTIAYKKQVILLTVIWDRERGILSIFCFYNTNFF